MMRMNHGNVSASVPSKSKMMSLQRIGARYAAISAFTRVFDALWGPGSGGARLARPHQLHEPREEIVAVARAGRRFGVVLHREHRPVLQRDAAVRAVEQRHMGLLDVLRQAVLVH